MQNEPNQPDASESKVIRHTPPAFNLPSTEAPPTPALRDPAPLPVATGVGQMAAEKKITAMGKELRHEETWNRIPNLTGQGAIHLRTFHSKITEDALTYMDQTINEWLDAHPQFEVKFVSTTVGILSGKLKEPALICQVWV